MSVIDIAGPSIAPMAATFLEAWTNQRCALLTPYELARVHAFVSSNMYDAALLRRSRRFNVTRCRQIGRALRFSRCGKRPAVATNEMPHFCSAISSAGWGFTGPRLGGHSPRQLEGIIMRHLEVMSAGEGTQTAEEKIGMGTAA
jgi:hypothetical protein